MADESTDYSSVLSRRRFVELTGVTGAAALAGCDGDGDGTEPEPTETTDDSGGDTSTDDGGDGPEYPDAEHVSGTTVVPSDVQFNPENGEGAPQISHHLLFEKLAQFYYTEGAYQPGAITDWNYDGETLELQLRDGLQWSNGDDVTGEDLVRQMRVWETSGGHPMWEWASDVEADGNTVTVTVGDTVNPALVEFDVFEDWLRYPADPFDDIMDSSEDLASTRIDDPITNGPFQFEEKDDQSMLTSHFSGHPDAGDINFGNYSFNIIGGVPKMLDATYEAEEVPDTDLELAIGPIATGVWEAFEAKFDLTVLQLYSQTESLTVLANHPDPEKVRVGSIGKPMFPDLGHEAWVEDEDGNELGPGERGELVRTDPGAMIGYRDLPEKTRETLRERVVYSGDVVYRDEEGYVYYVDRKKFMVRRAGENVSAQEVEDVIDELDGVSESAVIPAPDEVRGEEVKALVMRTDGAVTERDVVLQVGRTLASYKVPRYVEFVESFPRTPTERIRRVALADEEAARDDHGWDREAEFPDWERRV
jgi:acyl-CoA synthetase (AMP-forming)/AMP-acid ligase II